MAGLVIIKQFALLSCTLMEGFSEYRPLNKALLEFQTATFTNVLQHCEITDAHMFNSYTVEFLKSACQTLNLNLSIISLRNTMLSSLVKVQSGCFVLVAMDFYRTTSVSALYGLSNDPLKTLELSHYSCMSLSVGATFSHLLVTFVNKTCTFWLGYIDGFTK